MAPVSALDAMESPDVGISKRPPRRYAFACSNCRKKKIRCDGDQPECGSCAKAEEDCQYPKQRVQSELQQAQKRIKQLESELGQARSSIYHGSNQSSSPGALYSNPDQDNTLYSQLGFDEHGSLTYHGPTSHLHDSAFVDHQDLTLNREDDRAKEELRVASLRDFRVNHDYESRVWLPSLYKKPIAEFGLPPDLANHLLSAFFVWQNAFHNFVYKSPFIRDLAMGGPYCSRFLLMCIFALAARHCTHDSLVYRDKGERCLVLAKELLVAELGSSHPAITTIQGLLILGYRQCEVGNTSEGWLFSGMAFRMMTDIGLHLDTQKLSRFEQLDLTDIEARKRLALSACAWDKILSLTLGRPPSLAKLSVSVEDIFDEYDDGGSWRPLSCEVLDDYTLTKCYNTTAFKNLCKLGDLITAVVVMASDPNVMAADGQIELMQHRLESFYEQLPPEIRIDEPSQWDICPPPHIFGLNVLYRTLLVILFRQYATVSLTARSQVPMNALRFISEQAIFVHDLFILYSRTFQYRGISYLFSYCLYIVATVDTAFIRIGDEGQRRSAAIRLKLSLQILEIEARQTPSLKRIIDVIKKHIKTAAQEQDHGAPSSSRSGFIVHHGSNSDRAGGQGHGHADPPHRHRHHNRQFNTLGYEFAPSFAHLSSRHALEGYDHLVSAQQQESRAGTGSWEPLMAFGDSGTTCNSNALTWPLDESISHPIYEGETSFRGLPSSTIP